MERIVGKLLNVGKSSSFGIRKLSFFRDNVFPPPIKQYFFIPVSVKLCVIYYPCELYKICGLHDGEV
jgi:hypothetical protein